MGHKWKSRRTLIIRRLRRANCGLWILIYSEPCQENWLSGDTLQVKHPCKLLQKLGISTYVPRLAGGSRPSIKWIFTHARLRFSQIVFSCILCESMALHLTFSTLRGVPPFKRRVISSHFFKILYGRVLMLRGLLIGLILMQGLLDPSALGDVQVISVT